MREGVRKIERGTERERKTTSFQLREREGQRGMDREREREGE